MGVKKKTLNNITNFTKNNKSGFIKKLKPQ